MYLVNASMYLLHNTQGLIGAYAFSDKQEKKKKTPVRQSNMGFLKPFKKYNISSIQIT